MLKYNVKILNIVYIFGYKIYLTNANKDFFTNSEIYGIKFSLYTQKRNALYISLSFILQMNINPLVSTCIVNFPVA